MPQNLCNVFGDEPCHLSAGSFRRFQDHFPGPEIRTKHKNPRGGGNRPGA